jgi:hypothetical protein
MVEENAKALEAKADQESEKLYFDSMKHLTTLSTGSIVLLISFMKDLFKENTHWKGVLALSLCSFVGSIICSVSSMLQSANYVRYTGKYERLEDKIKDIIYYGSLITFMLGIGSLVLFALLNLFRG